MDAGNYSAAAADFQAALPLPSLLDSTFLEMKTARSYALGGDTDAALALYDDIYSRTNNDYTKALIDLRKGQILPTWGSWSRRSRCSWIQSCSSLPLMNLFCAAIPGRGRCTGRMT